MNTREYIVLHHTGSYCKDGSEQYDAVNRYHKSKGWGKIGYHYLIERSGRIRNGRAETEIGAHCSAARMNYIGVGICLAGDFTQQLPSDKQMVALKSLMRDVMLRNKIEMSNVILHREVGLTACPGIDLRIYQPTLNPHRVGMLTRFLARIERIIGSHGY